MSKGLGRAVHLAHHLLSEVVTPGGTAIDATAGNGYDSLFLARLVGPRGKVYAIDIQADALEKTSRLLLDEGVRERVVLVQASHEQLGEIVNEQVDGVIFNLGYLPGGDHKLVTTGETTVRALNAALERLKPGGRVALVVYIGHPGGQEECEALEGLISSLDITLYQAVRLSFYNRSKAPIVIVIEKAGVNDEKQPATKDN